MKTSETEKREIQTEEGFRLVAYPDTGGVWTIGYGETEGVKKGDHWTQEQANDRFASRILKIEEVINTTVQVELTQNEFDALVSFVYNIGEGAWKKSHALIALNQGNYEECAAQMNRWVHVNGEIDVGLVNRRSKETTLFTKEWKVTDNGSVAPTPPPVKVTETTTGQISLAKIGIGATGAATWISNEVNNGLDRTQPIVDTAGRFHSIVSGFSGYPALIIGSVLGIFLLLDIALLIHKKKNLGSASQ